MLEDFESVFARVNARLNAKKIPKLKTLLRGAVNNVSNLTNLLVRKSFLKENLYNYSDDDSEKFFLPDEKAFMDNEKQRVVYDRLKAFMSALEYLANTLHSDIDEVSDKYINNISKILVYFNFQNINAPGAGINTKALKDMTDRIMTGKDQILRRVVQDNLKLLSDNFKKIKATIDSFIRYKFERYKSHIRFKVFPFLQEEEFTEKMLQENPSLFLKKLKRFMDQSVPGIPFNKYWIAESIKACYSEKPEDELENIKKIFLKDTIQTNNKNIMASPREKLIGIIDFLAHSNHILEKIYIRMEQNLKFVFNRKRNFLEQIVDIFKKAVSSANQDEFFQLEYINPSNKQIQNDTININDFMLFIKKKIVLFRNVLNGGSATNEKVKKGSEEALYKFLEETYFDMLLTKERIIGINGEIRLRLKKTDRMKLKDVSEPIEELDDILKKVSDQRRKYVIEQEKTMFKK